ncbi:MAG: hypothetical protein QM785_06000 [Pyrinomonadaceae bacterium]
MTKLLEKAFSKASELPTAEQDILAQALLDDLEAEELWDETFAASQDSLSAFADEALAEYAGKQTRPIEDIL